MLKELQFVRGAVGKYNNEMAMQHFVIRDGRVTGYNGILAISSPVPIGLECQPNAAKLVKAVGNAKAAVELSLTPAGKLRFKSGNIKAILIDNHPDPIAEVWPEGDDIPVNGPKLLESLRKLVPFVCRNEEAQQWSQGILFSGSSAFATNNYILTECWVESMFPHPANVPLATVLELLRIGEPPTHVSMGYGNMTFHFEGERWLRTQLFSNEWPSNVRHMLPTKNDNLKALPHDFWDAVSTCRDMREDTNKLYIDDEYLRTTPTEEDGTHIYCPGAGGGIYNVNHMWLLKDHVVAAQFTSKIGKFMGDKIRGIINPMRR